LGSHRFGGLIILLRRIFAEKIERKVDFVGKFAVPKFSAPRLEEFLIFVGRLKSDCSCPSFHLLIDVLLKALCKTSAIIGLSLLMKTKIEGTEKNQER
jgi:hypothetical protein